MNDRRRKFCELYAANPNATEAAKAAGYSAATAYSIGQRLLKSVETKKYIDELMASAKSERIATITETLEYLTDVMRDPNEPTRERTKAAQMLIAALDEKHTDDDPLDCIEFQIVDLTRGERLTNEQT